MNSTIQKVIIVTFEAITKDSAGGIGNLSYELSKHLYKKDRNVLFYTINKGPHQTEFPSKSVHWTSRYFLFILNLLFKYKLLGGVTKRKAEEWYFDFFLSLQPLSGDYLISTHGFIPKTLKNHSHKFKSICYIPPTPNEEVIYNLCQVELSTSKVKDAYHDAYTDIGRITNFKRTIPYFTKVISISPVTSSSYTGIVKNVVELPFVNAPKKNYTNIESKRKDDQKVVFLYIAYSVLLKGLHRLLAEWESASLKAAELHIVGPIDPQYATAFNIDFNKNASVKFLGYAADTSVFYQSADVVVIPSLIDGEPHIAIEALSYNKPVLISDGCGHARLIGNSVPEAVFNIQQPGELANKLKLAASNLANFTANFTVLADFVQNRKFDYSSFYDKVEEEVIL